MTTTIQFADLSEHIGRDLGFTDYLQITQDRVNLFADAADDHQWIHVDPERAASGPFGATIAHGFLTLSLLVPFTKKLLTVEGARTIINYGFDKVRFPTPVKVGDRVRLRAEIAEVTAVANGFQVAVDGQIEVQNVAKPAVVATWLSRYYG